MTAFAETVRAESAAMQDEGRRCHVVFAEGWDHVLDEFQGVGRCIASNVDGDTALAAMREADEEGRRKGWKGCAWITDLEGRQVLTDLEGRFLLGRAADLCVPA